MAKMQEVKFTDSNGLKLVIKYRKSAVFFLKYYEADKTVTYPDVGTVVSLDEMKETFVLSEDKRAEFRELITNIANECWTNFQPKDADSFGADYAEYYDREFDNEGILHLTRYNFTAEGPFTQKPNKQNIVRLFKFNKRKLESFVYDLDLLWGVPNE